MTDNIFVHSVKKIWLGNIAEPAITDEVESYIRYSSDGFVFILTNQGGDYVHGVIDIGCLESVLANQDIEFELETPPVVLTYLKELLVFAKKNDIAEILFE